MRELWMRKNLIDFHKDKQECRRNESVRRFSFFFFSLVLFRVSHLIWRAYVCVSVT